MNTENKLKIDDFTKALAECIHQAQCAVVDPMAHAEIWKDELLELAKGKELVSEEQVKEFMKTQHIKETCKENGKSLTQEPVSEGLDIAIGEYCSNPDNFITYIDVAFAYRSEQKDDIPLIIKAIKFGANWQKVQIIKRLCNHVNIDKMVEKFEDKYKPKKVLDTEYYKHGIFDTIKAIKED